MTTLQNSLRSTNIKRALLEGLRAFRRPVPRTLSDWADENFYLSSESSYVEGRWTTLPFQKAPMNAIGHPDIPVVNIIKSARVGYSQMLRAALGYFAEHKSRNQILYQPTDTAAAGFMKAHIETMIRDVPVVREIAPWHGKKDRDSTLDTKRFSNGKQLWCLGGKAAKNYREKSADNVYYDELAGFDQDVEKEGSPTFLGDKRLEGSVFPKSVRGSTPKIAGECQMTKAAETAKCFFKFHIPCPHCDHEQTLKWGGKDCEFGFKWDDDDPSSVMYLCENCGAFIDNRQLPEMQEKGVWLCEKTGISTSDGMVYYGEDGEKVDTPESVTFHIWTAYSLFTTWQKIVEYWIEAHKDRTKLKTFVNTTLGETWEEDEGDKLEGSPLYERREHYKATVPIESGIMTCAVDVQNDRFEVEHVLWVEGEESYRINYEQIYGDLSKEWIWEELYENITQQFKSVSGNIFETKICFIDSGGSYTDEVYKFCKKRGPRKFVAIKGYSEYGKPIANWPKKRNSKGVYLTMIGTDTAKEIITDRLRQQDKGPGYMHYPISPQFSEEYFTMLTNERRVPKIVKGKKKFIWDAGGRRNEPFDLSVYNLAAVRTLQQHFGVRLPSAEKRAIIKSSNSVKKKRKKRYNDDDGWI